MEDLTNEQKKLLALMYKEVLSRQPALPFEEANYFQNSDNLIELFDIKYDSDHMSSLCWKLFAKDYIFCTPGEDLANNIILSDKAIIYMENKFKSSVKEILSFLAKFK